MDLNALFFDFFGRRIAERGQYTLAEYLVYGAIVLFIAFFILYPVLDRRGIRFNKKFFLALLPYILLGSSLRVLEDMALLPRSWNPLEAAYYLVTPGIYLLIAVVAIACLFVSLLAAKKLHADFHLLFAGIGIALALPIVAFEMLNFVAWPGFLAVIAIVLAIVAFLYFIFRLFKSRLLQSSLNVLVVASQALDGAATFVATSFFRCGEQHPLSGFFLDLWPFSFVAVKVGLVLAILYYVDKDIKNSNLRGFIKIVVAILGFATGLRDLLTLGVGTCL